MAENKDLDVIVSTCINQWVVLNYRLPNGMLDSKELPPCTIGHKISFPNIETKNAFLFSVKGFIDNKTIIIGNATEKKLLAEQDEINKAIAEKAQAETQKEIEQLSEKVSQNAGLDITIESGLDAPEAKGKKK